MLTQSNNRSRSKIIAGPQELFDIFATPGIEVINLLSAADKVAWITWMYAE
jgi:hypothetical protein